MKKETKQVVSLVTAASLIGVAADGLVLIVDKIFNDNQNIHDYKSNPTDSEILEWELEMRISGIHSNGAINLMKYITGITNPENISLNSNESIFEIEDAIYNTRRNESEEFHDWKNSLKGIDITSIIDRISALYQGNDHFVVLLHKLGTSEENNPNAIMPFNAPIDYSHRTINPNDPDEIMCVYYLALQKVNSNLIMEKEQKQLQKIDNGQ